MSSRWCDEIPTDSPSSIQNRAWMACVRSASDTPTRKASAMIALGRLTDRRAVARRANRARGRAIVAALTSTS
jgi:hypothetical protein